MAEVLTPLADHYQPRGMSNQNQKNNRSAYRANSPAVPSYAFQSTPTAHRTESPLRNESKPTSPQPLASSETASNRQRHIPAQESISTTSSSSSSLPPSLPPLSKDDSALFSTFSMPSFTPEVSSVANENEPPKAVPGRYRHKRNDTAGSTASANPPKPSGLAGVTASGAFGNGKLGQFQYTPQQFGGANSPSQPSADPVPSSDENRVQSPVERADLPKRYRRRSSFGNTVDANAASPPGSRSGATASRGSTQTPQSNIQPPQDARPASSTSAHQPSGSMSQGGAPARSFTSADAVRRINNPSPLSRPMSGETSAQQSSSQTPASAAMAALNANEKQDQKGVKSRLRRAFSFGSSAELKRATEQDAAINRARARQERFSTELDEEQDAVVKQQEASGLGNSIYSGQGGVFAGSTDNLSISSTASSASLMLRKMGKGLKKGGKSMKGLFRPKSVIGVPAADGPSQASVGQVSMVNVEAEREKVNINVDPRDQPGGGTGFPKLERNSLDAARTTGQTNGDKSDLSLDTRRSVVGNEQDRQDVLAAVKRGILKRQGTSSPNGSPSIQPVDGTQDLPSPGRVMNLDRRPSPVPSTTSSEPRRTGHRRTDSRVLEGDDYFTSVPRITGNNQSSKSLPDTPRGISKNISFSPRIQFHDAWSASEYDRRGEIATCNRLTPMLAQQIKEELNTFKMEMEVHEASKPHTHFF